jgi:hypothetical protein
VVTRFMVLYVGPATPPDASHEGWPAWFGKLGDKLVDRGSPITDGMALRADGSTSGPASRLNGYSVIQAEDIGEALGLVRGPPLPGAGSRVLGRGPYPAVSAHSTSTMASTSTGAPSGSEATPTAARACLPASPKTSTSSSLAPLTTLG